NCKVLCPMAKYSVTKSNIANDDGSVEFPCPKCGTMIARSRHERAIVAKYSCPKCGFEGPN
ncbi:MAG: zinc finger domain-containing protein, partial [Nanoarchaeota archaeon]